MKKKLAVLAAAAVAAGILFSGCGGSKNGGTKSSSAAWKPEKDVKIIVAYKVCRPAPGHRKQTRG